MTTDCLSPQVRDRQLRRRARLCSGRRPERRRLGRRRRDVRGLRRFRLGPIGPAGKRPLRVARCFGPTGKRPLRVARCFGPTGKRPLRVARCSDDTSDRHDARRSRPLQRAILRSRLPVLERVGTPAGAVGAPAYLGYVGAPLGAGAATASPLTRGASAGSGAALRRAQLRWPGVKYIGHSSTTRREVQVAPSREPAATMKVRSTGSSKVSYRATREFFRWTRLASRLTLLNGRSTVPAYRRLRSSTKEKSVYVAVSSRVPTRDASRHKVAQGRPRRFGCTSRRSSRPGVYR